MGEPGGPQRVCPKAGHRCPGSPPGDGREAGADFLLCRDSTGLNAHSEQEGVIWAGLHLYPKLTLPGLA